MPCANTVDKTVEWPQERWFVRDGFHMSKREFPCASKAAILTSERIPKQTTLCEALQHGHTSRGHTSMEDVVVLDYEDIRVFFVFCTIEMSTRKIQFQLKRKEGE